jgi:integrase
MIFDCWVEEYGGALNVSRILRNPKNSRKTRRTRPTVAQRLQLEGQVGDSGGGLFLAFLLYTSARKGEILALQYKDIDLDARLIRITKSVTYMGNAPIVTDTKTENSVRDNPILDPFFPILQRALARRHKGTAYIFGGEDGEQPITSSQFEKMWLDLLEPIGLTTMTDGSTWKGSRKSQRRAIVTPHQLRHEYAYTLYKAGVPTLLAKTLMGHADIRTTQNIYTELEQEDIADSAKLLNAYYVQRDAPAVTAAADALSVADAPADEQKPAV